MQARGWAETLVGTITTTVYGQSTTTDRDSDPLGVSLQIVDHGPRKIGVNLQ
jgi:hypothetical protein